MYSYPSTFVNPSSNSIRTLLYFLVPHPSHQHQQLVRYSPDGRYLVVRNDVAALSPYLTSHIKRFGDYLIDLDAVPQALDEEIALTF